jgi:membrane protein
MKPQAIKRALLQTYDRVDRRNTLEMAAALAYYFTLSLFPALIFLSAIFAYLPAPDLFNQSLGLMAYVLPPDSMGVIRTVLADVLTSNRGTFLSVGILGTLWTSSGALAASIKALNRIYEVHESRPFWRTRSLALGLAFTIELLMLVALSAMIVGPRFGEWIARRVHLSGLFVLLWPCLRWTIAVGFAVLAVEILYFFGPNVEQRVRATFPGAIVAVASWTGLSYLLGEYLRYFARFNKTYGALGAAIALMVWLYWIGFAILAGAELNAELAKVSPERKLQV